MLPTLGWEPVDVRLMANKTDEDRRNTVRATLEGVRMGTIEPDVKRLKFLELEAKILGMLGTKTPTGLGDLTSEGRFAVDSLLGENQ